MSSSKAKKLKSQFQDFESGAKKSKYLRLANDMLESPAWKSLSVYSQAVYVRMKQKFTGNNGSDISMTYAEIGDTMNERTFTKSRNELIAKGFIRFVEHNKYTRKCNIYGFSSDWKTYKKCI